MDRTMIKCIESKNFYDIASKHKYEFKSYKITAEISHISPLSKSIHVVDSRNSGISIDKGKGADYDLPATIKVDKHLKSADLAKFISNLQEAKELADFIENNAEFFYKEE